MTRVRRPRGQPLTPAALLAASLVTVALALAACGGGTSVIAGTTPLPAGPTPSKIATMVCADKAVSQMNSALGENAAVSTPTWSAKTHVYSCTYGYPSGSFTLSVKELSSWPATMAYFAALEASMGKSRDLYGLGQAAFQATDGSVVVRKDWKVLTVDPAGLPAQFGVPATSSRAVAFTVADVILGCWEGD